MVDFFNDSSQQVSLVKKRSLLAWHSLLIAPTDQNMSSFPVSPTLIKNCATDAIKSTLIICSHEWLI